MMSLYHLVPGGTEKRSLMQVDHGFAAKIIAGGRIKIYLLIKLKDMKI